MQKTGLLIGFINRASKGMLVHTAEGECGVCS
jgi:hypothetical protein